VPIDAIVNIVVSGLLTGLVYGLMALGLSVIYGVVRIVNFAHGELMTLAMYAAVSRSRWPGSTRCGCWCRWRWRSSASDTCCSAG